MGRRRKFGRSVNGVVVIDKPSGMTSNDVVQKIKRLFFANKVGHTGALDPLATGVLPICLGEATKFSQYLLDSDKAYISDFVFGQVTDTADADGTIVAESDASALTEKQVKKAIQNYLGEIDQVPPMYSALKKDGQPLYKLARQGIEVEREARRINVYAFELVSFIPAKNPVARVKVSCSKGTYIRSLAEDLGRDLGVGAHVGALRRIGAGVFKEAEAHTLESLNAERGEQQAEVLDYHLLSMDTPVSELPKLDLDDDSGFYFTRGQAVMDSQVYKLGDEGDKVRVFNESGQFLGLGEINDEGGIAPKRLVVYS